MGAAAILLHPAVIDISAWWGQYESIYLLSALAAVVFAINGHNGPAAALVAVSLMTKPQALPFILPVRGVVLGDRRLARSSLRTGVDRARRRSSSCGCRSSRPAARRPTWATWRQYQSGVFAILSLRAWNAWWLVQELAAWRVRSSRTMSRSWGR